jgi:hypothetical protein
MMHFRSVVCTEDVLYRSVSNKHEFLENQPNDIRTLLKGADESSCT